MCSEPSADKCVQRITGRLLVWNPRRVTADVTRVSPVSRSQATIFLSQDTVTILTHTERFTHRCTQVTTWKFLHCCFLWTLCFFHVYVISVRDYVKPYGRWISHRLIHKDVFSSKKWRKSFPNNNLFLVLCLAACCSSRSIVDWGFILFEWLYHQIKVKKIATFCFTNLRKSTFRSLLDFTVLVTANLHKLVE